jgi:hypothetical protein
MIESIPVNPINTDELKTEPQAKIEPRKHNEPPLKLNRSQRRYLASYKREAAMKDPDLRLRESIKQMKFCPICKLNYLGSSESRCQCKAIQPSELR